jgi:predicted phage terminase large subunit-like protein
MSSGSSLIQQLRADGLSKVRAAPSLEGSKIMRLNGQTPMIEGGFVLFPKTADWLETYLSELLSFPSSNYDDQVDSTVYALAWIAENPQYAGTFFKRSSIHYYDSIPEDQRYKRVFMAWDTALKDGGHGDWTVCTVWLLLDKQCYLLHIERGIYDYSELLQKFNQLSQQFKPFKILIEETTTGMSLKMDRDLPGRYLIKLVPIELDRKGRVYVLQSMFKKGLVRFPKDAPFMRDVENELLSYPYGQTDDIVDSISLALNYKPKEFDYANF